MRALGRALRSWPTRAGRNGACGGRRSGTPCWLDISSAQVDRRFHAPDVVLSSEFTLDGAVSGTPRYMAMEQLLGGEVTAQSDLFSAGVVLYECVTGARPFDAQSALAAIARMLDGPPTPVAQMVPDVPPAFAALIESLLEYEPCDRPASARELADRLRAMS